MLGRQRKKLSRVTNLRTPMSNSSAGPLSTQAELKVTAKPVRSARTAFKTSKRNLVFVWESLVAILTIKRII